MKNRFLLLIVLSFSLSACNGQRKFDKKDNKIDSIKPKTDIQVHKEYDDQGNLISVDSTYSYFYSNIKNDSLLENEVFKKFKSHFDKSFESVDSLYLKDFFMNDPFLDMNDFYTNDFFQNNINSQLQNMQHIFKQMDSLKNSYYKEQDNLLRKNKS